MDKELLQVNHRRHLNNNRIIEIDLIDSHLMSFVKTPFKSFRELELFAYVHKVDIHLKNYA